MTSKNWFNLQVNRATRFWLKNIGKKRTFVGTLYTVVLGERVERKLVERAVVDILMRIFIDWEVDWLMLNIYGLYYGPIQAAHEDGFGGVEIYGVPFK